MSKEARFQRIFWIIAGIHLAVIAGFLLHQVIQSWLLRRNPPELITYVSLHVPDTSAAAEPAREEPTPRPPEPKPPEPPPPIPPPPEPRPRPPRQPIERSTNRVHRVPERPPTPTLTADQIAQQLAGTLPTTTTQTAPTSDVSWYYNQVHATLNAAWEQPGGAAPGSMVRVHIRIQRDGTISQREIIRRSGNSIMDDSVQRAVQSVSRLRPLPPEIPGSHHDVTIDFELTRSGL